MIRRKLFGYLLLLCLGTLFPVQGQVYIMVDVTNNVAMAKNNDIHIAGFEGLEAISKKILHYQTWIAGFTTRLVEREEERITSLLEVDDLYGDNQQWKDNFVARLDTLEQNLEVIRQMIDSYPKTSKLQKNYERLVEDLEDTEKKVFELVQKRNTGDYVPIRQVVMNAMEKIEKASKNKGNVTGVATGFIDLDYRTAGMQPSDLVLIAARPSMGKTTLSLNIAENAALKEGKSVVIFSLEMSKEQLAYKLLCSQANVDMLKLRTGNLDDDDWERIARATGPLSKAKIYIDDTAGITVMEMRSKCRKIKMEHGIDMILIDYLQLMSGSSGNDNRQQEVSEISRSIKALAKEMECPVIALSQLSRAPEQRADHRPMLSDLRESGSIEQDADVVMFLYRDEYYNKETEEKNIGECIIAKQRNGPVGTVKMAWIGAHSKFADLDLVHTE